VGQLFLKYLFKTTIKGINKKRLEGILEGLQLIHEEFNLPIIYPIHPRTTKRIKEFGLKLEVPTGIELIEPLGFLEFLQLEANAKLVLHDFRGFVFYGQPK